MKKTIFLLLFLFPFASFADVIFYGNCDYQGNGVALAPGDYTAKELAQFGIPEDAIASVDVPRGYVVTVHENDNFEGRYGTLRRSDSCLEGARFSNVISSLSIRKSFGEIFSEQTPASSRNEENAVVLFTKCEYQGRSAKLHAGDYNLAQLVKLGIANNSISSIKIPKGFAITLYENDFLRGNAGKLQRSDNCLINDKFDDRVTSVSVRQLEGAAVVAKPTIQKPLTGVELYTACDYQDDSVALQEGEYTSADLKKLGLLNNSISAIRVGQGYQIELFENDFYRGRSGTLRQDDPCLVDDRFNDTISSVTVSRDPRAQVAVGATVQSPVVTVFAHCNYKGGSLELPVGKYDMAKLRQMKIQDNVISSLKISEGYTATLYDENSFAGKGVKFSGNDDCLDDNKMNERISSLVIEKATAQRDDSLTELMANLSNIGKGTSDETMTKALDCIEQYVERNLCVSQHWREMEKRCALATVIELNDGYLRGHVNAGNCKQEYWTELARRSANPRLR